VLSGKVINLYLGSLPCAMLSCDPVIAEVDEKLELVDESDDVAPGTAATTLEPVNSENQSPFSVRFRPHPPFYKNSTHCAKAPTKF
jgi:hypothetical protein